MVGISLLLYKVYKSEKNKYGSISYTHHVKYDFIGLFEGEGDIIHLPWSGCITPLRGGFLIHPSKKLCIGIISENTEYILAEFYL